MLEKRRSVSHLEELLLGVLRLSLLRNLSLAVVGMLVAPLQKHGNNHSTGAERQAETEASVVLGVLTLQVHKATDNTTDVANTIHEGNTDGSARGWRDVVGIP